jgi:hypothetical protein
MLVLVLLAKGPDPFQSPEVIWGTAGLAIALLAGAVLVYLADRWRKRVSSAGVETGGELTEYRRMFDRGEITEEEYVRLRDRVAKRVKAPPAAAATGVAGPGKVSPVAPDSLPGPDQPTPPPEAGKPANPPSPA